MLLDKLRSSPRIATRAPRARLDQHLYTTRGGDAKQPESKKPAEPAYPRVTFSTAAALR
jgi:hypothetical protein